MFEKKNLSYLSSEDPPSWWDLKTCSICLYSIIYFVPYLRARKTCQTLQFKTIYVKALMNLLLVANLLLLFKSWTSRCYFSYCSFSSNGNNFSPNRHVTAVCFTWVTSSWAPFKRCLLVKISTVFFCHMDGWDIRGGTTEGEQTAASSLYESSSTFVCWFCHLTEKVCFLCASFPAQMHIYSPQRRTQI